MGEPRVTRGQLPANEYGNDPYDTGIGVGHYLVLIEPRDKIETAADLANVIADQLSDFLKNIPENNMFVGWNGKIFENDILWVLRQQIRMLSSNSHNRNNLKKLKLKKFIDDSIWHLKDSPKIRTPLINFDANAYELNTPNGIINLRTGRRIPHRAPSLVTKLTNTSPKEERCERLHQFLDEVTDGDPSLQEFLQVMFGACLSGAPEAHWMAFILGPTRSGKSLIVELLAHIMGNYAHTTDGSL